MSILIQLLIGWNCAPVKICNRWLYVSYFTICYYICTGPAVNAVTDRIYKQTKHIKEYSIVPNLEVPINSLGTQTYEVCGITFAFNWIYCYNFIFYVVNDWYLL